MTTVDYSLLDHPQISLNSFYPQRRTSPTPLGAVDHMVQVENDVSVSCRFFPCAQEQPTILFFYGNGEVSADYDGIAPLYHQLGINLFVADYRGYGRSGGSPTFGAILADAHQVLQALRKLLHAEGYSGPLYVMGRSMGRHPAFELEASAADSLRGLIVESGRPTLGQFTHGLDTAAAEALEAAYMEKVRSITLPVLVIHGEQDTLAPLEEAVSMYQAFGSKDKKLTTIPGAGHNDLLHLGLEQYAAAIRDFVFR